MEIKSAIRVAHKRCFAAIITSSTLTKIISVIIDSYNKNHQHKVSTKVIDYLNLRDFVK